MKNRKYLSILALVGALMLVAAACGDDDGGGETSATGGGGGGAAVDCEADDPTNAFAFDTRVNPLSARINAMFASDIGHWDVPDFREVLPEVSRRWPKPPATMPSYFRK